jgi:hypothetical protein
VTLTEKNCPDCSTIKPASEFYPSKKGVSGLYSYCKPCTYRRNSKYQMNRFGSKRWMNIFHKYGLTQAAYEAMDAEQHGLCAVCTVRPCRVIDHDHTTGVVRALLCSGCNAFVGYLEKDATWYQRAIAYLERHA